MRAEEDEAREVWCKLVRRVCVCSNHRTESVCIIRVNRGEAKVKARAQPWHVILVVTYGGTTNSRHESLGTCFHSKCRHLM